MSCGENLWKKMKILIIQTSEYDFCSASLIEGLNCLIAKGVKVEIKCSERSNYAATKYWNFCDTNSDSLQNFGDESDFVLITSNNGVKEGLIKSSWEDKLVYLDGEDKYIYNRKPEDYLIYFKREMRINQEHEHNVFPFPFAAENRYFHIKPDFENFHIHRNISVCCMFGPHDSTKPWRKNIEDKLIEMNIQNSFIKNNYDGISTVDIDTGGRDHSSYYATLANSKIAVDAYGAYGCNAGRFWESLAAGCLLFTQPILIHMPNAFNINHLIQFSSPSTMEKEIKDFLRDTKEANKMMVEIAKNGYEHLLRYHTTEARARYFLDTLQNYLRDNL